MFDSYDEIFSRRAGSCQSAMVELPLARRREFEAAAERAGPLAGIEDAVGVDEDPGGVKMAWQLRYLVCRA